MPPASTYWPSTKGARRVSTRPPGRSRASRTTTSWPASESSKAAARPASPAPRTMTFRGLPALDARCAQTDLTERPSAASARNARRRIKPLLLHGDGDLGAEATGERVGDCALVGGGVLEVRNCLDAEL